MLFPSTNPELIERDIAFLTGVISFFLFHYRKIASGDSDCPVHRSDSGHADDSFMYFIHPDHYHSLKGQAFELEEQYYGDVADIKNPVQYQENPFTALFGIGKAKMELS